MTPNSDLTEEYKYCGNCADGEPPVRSKPWTCARVFRKEQACNNADKWKPLPKPQNSKKTKERRYRYITFDGKQSKEKRKDGGFKRRRKR